MTTPANKLEGSNLDAKVSLTALEAGGNLATVLGRVPSEVAQKSHLVNGAGDITPPADKGIWDALGNGGALAQPADILTDVAHKVDGGLISTDLDATIGSRATPGDVTSAQSALTTILTKIQNFLKKTRLIGG